jgi:hypothetical protein
LHDFLKQALVSKPDGNGSPEFLMGANCTGGLKQTEMLLPLLF